MASLEIEIGTLTTAIILIRVMRLGQSKIPHCAMHEVYYAITKQ